MLAIRQIWINITMDRRAVTAVEYAMIAALIAAVCVTAVTTLGTNINSLFLSVGKKI